jgi:vacuolar-type H+-ATPase subunit F/Vma7
MEKNLDKIAIIGNEDFTFGFEIIGMESFKIEELEKLISKENNFGIVIIEKENYDKLSLGLKTKIDNLVKPIFIILNEDLNDVSDINKLIKKSLGIDLSNK